MPDLRPVSHRPPLVPRSPPDLRSDGAAAQPTRPHPARGREGTAPLARVDARRRPYRCAGAPPAEQRGANGRDAMPSAPRLDSAMRTQIDAHPTSRRTATAMRPGWWRRCRAGPCSRSVPTPSSPRRRCGSPRCSRPASLAALGRLARLADRRWPASSPRTLRDRRDGRDTVERRAVRLRETLERTGGTFIKFGQQLSVRADVLPYAYCRELIKMLDRVPPFPTEQAIATIERATGKRVGGAVRRLRPRARSDPPRWRACTRRSSSAASASRSRCGGRGSASASPPTCAPWTGC